MKSTLLAVTIVVLSIFFIWKPSKAEMGYAEQLLAQKIMLDIRYYCPELDSDKIKSGEVKCTIPITELPEEIAELISETSLGGVILFADNLESIGQIIQLTSDLQQAASKSKLAQPLFISVDQEGGRVVRLPREIATSFTGNMSIGNTYELEGTHLAGQVGEAIGAELNALGINVNHAPTVDVNVNPNNPVINVRSFSNDPAVVAQMGIATLKGMQSQGVLATLKHFPGHGDTDVDSHHGLPIVHHDEDMITNVDLYPFQQAIDNANVNMIMTAHIQYPKLDNSMVINKFEQKMIRPATISKVILTDLLREKMGYKGLIITDALDMAGIADFFTPVEATLNTFAAGADIAMMPMKIRTQSDIDGFKSLLKSLALRVNEESEIKNTIQQSVQRVINTKHQFIADSTASQSIEAKISNAQKILASKKHRLLEQQLAHRGIVSNIQNQDAPSLIKTAKNIHLVTPKRRQANALKQFINEKAASNKMTPKNVSSLSIRAPKNEHMTSIEQSDLVIVAVDGIHSLVIDGGVEDHSTTTATDKLSQNKPSYIDILKMAKQQDKSIVLVSLNLPINNHAVEQYADWVITTFDDSAYYDENTQRYMSPALDALTTLMLN
ncbi:MAG: glycosyl hydrolase family 3 [Gammaproteobacteria bacterium]|nr:glycosyl hydrolase family 3 [Gammaproteobacteria bacterium]